MNNLEEKFRQYLINQRYKLLTPSGNPSTVYKYCKGIAGVCDDERITSDNLAIKIDRFVIDYGVGGIKQDKGAKSHSTVISALKVYKKFLRK